MDSAENPKAPTSPYGESKLMMENMIKWCDLAHGIRFVSLRYFNVGGALSTGEIGEDHDPVTHLIPIVLQTALGQRDVIPIFDDNYNTSDRTCIRDYVHVEDLIEAHTKSQFFNHTGYSVKEIVEASRKVMGKEIPAKIGERRAGDPVKLVTASEKARDILGG